GVAWAGRPDNSVELQRRVPLELLAGVAHRHRGNVLFASLQKGEASKQLHVLGLDWPDLGARCRDFADTAALMASLDAVVTSDTSVAHLAGALGLEAMVLLHTPSDWRWGHGGERSPWYASPRLLRQASPGDWPSVLARLDALLGERLGRRSA